MFTFNRCYATAPVASSKLFSWLLAPGSFILLSALFLVQALAASSDYRIEPVGALAAPEVAEAIRGSLEPRGVRLVDAGGTTVCELWLRSSIPLREGEAGTGYGKIDTGTLIGVLRFPAAGSDFRGQPIKAGYYTLRYQRMPSDGNHMGAAPSQDFLLLAPASVDRELGTRADFNEVVGLSRQASGTNHPAILMLVRPGGQNSSPSLKQDDYGYWVVELKTQGKPAGSDKPIDFPVALVLVGRAEV